jgi:farnesyl diphosphate synthase
MSYLTDLDSLDKLRNHFEQILREKCDYLTSSSPVIVEAIKYSTLSNSKKIRPLLIYATGIALNIEIERLDTMAIAVELIHTYSLVHDDLPAMDNDDLRRGRPTSHIKFGEANAILAGDALHSLAIEWLLSDPLLSSNDKNICAIQLLRAAGYQGMIAGQCLDLELLHKPDLTLNQLQQIHMLKTASLLSACISMPLSLSHSHTPQVKKQLQRLGSILGLVFQIQDDYLDRYGNSKDMGKSQGSDLEQDKKTFCDYYSKPELIVLMEQYYHEAQQCLSEIEQASLLSELISALACRAK